MKIGSPLFILREECKKDLMGVLDRLAEIGYDGVEFLSLFGHSPVDIRKKMEALELTAVGDHVPYIEFSDNTDKVVLLIGGSSFAKNYSNLGLYFKFKYEIIIFFQILY